MRPIFQSWLVAPTFGVCAVWFVTFAGTIITSGIEWMTGSTSLFWEASFLIPAFYGIPSGAIVAWFGAACGKKVWAVWVALGVHLLYCPIVAWAYYVNAVAPYSSAHAGVFWWVLIVGLVGGTAAGLVGGTLGQRRVIRQETGNGAVET